MKIFQENSYGFCRISNGMWNCCGPLFRSLLPVNFFFVIIFVVDSRFQNRSFYQVAPYNARCYNENMSHQLV